MTEAQDSEKHSVISTEERERLSQQRDILRAAYLHDRTSRPPTTARGFHHVALICKDVERTIEFYQGVLEFPLTELFENRDLAGSSHFFFDIGNGNLLAFFDLPGVNPSDYAEVLGGLHHLAISVEPKQWGRLRSKLDDRAISYTIDSGSSIYTHDPDGARVELISDPLLEMYGSAVG